MPAKNRTPWKDVGRYGSVGIELVVSILLGFFGGRWLDDRVGAGGWVTIAGVVVGVYAGFRALFKTAKFLERETARRDRERPWEIRPLGPNDEIPPDLQQHAEVAPDEKPGKTGAPDDEQHRDLPRKP